MVPSGAQIDKTSRFGEPFVRGVLIWLAHALPRKPSGQMANFANNGARELKIGQNDCFFHSSLAPHAPLWKHFTSEVIPEKLIFTPFGRR